MAIFNNVNCYVFTNMFESGWILLRELAVTTLYIRILYTGLFVYLPFRVFSGTSTVIDFTTRLNPNDAYISTYYFWWTNLTYLPLFFFITILLILGQFNHKFMKRTSFIFFILLIGYSFELQDYIILNAHDLSTPYGVYGINTLLLNALNKYHPLVFYSSVGILLSMWLHLVTYKQLETPYFMSLFKLQQVQMKGWLTPKLNLVALWMGSWWALQEGTWGGWWNWDPSEMFGLLVTLVVISILHMRPVQLNLYQMGVKMTILFYLFIITYFFIQLNFDLVSHNFGSKFFFFFNNNLFFIEVSQLLSILSLTVTLAAFINKLTTRKIFNWALTEMPLVTWQVRLVPFVLIVLFNFWSFRPLINYFIWNFFEINVVNFETELQPFILLFSITLIAWLLEPASSLIFLTVLLAWYSLTYLPLLLLSFNFLSSVRSLHALFTYFVILSVLTNGLAPIEWLCIPDSNYFIINSSLQILNSELLVLDGTSFESINIRTFTDGSNLLAWNINTFANSPLNNFFQLITSEGGYQNFYQLGGVYSTSYLNLELPFIGGLNSLFTVFIIILNYVYFVNQAQLRN